MNPLLLAFALLTGSSEALARGSRDGGGWLGFLGLVILVWIVIANVSKKK